MIVDNAEGFKAWMTTVLEPICDADPAALAKYVYALVKKDKPFEEIRKGMVAQLEVFLLKETEKFVELLFNSLVCKDASKSEYKFEVKIKEDVDEQAEMSEPIQNPVEVEDVTLPTKETEVSTTVVEESRPIEKDDLPPKEPPAEPPEPLKPAVILPDVSYSATHSDKEVAQVAPPSPRLRNGSYGGSNPTLHRQERLNSSRSHERKSDSEREEKGLPRRRGSSSSPPLRHLQRSRSRSWERRSTLRRSRSKSRRSRSRGRDRDHSRPWRNKSPPMRRGYERDRKMRSWSKSPPPRSRSRSPLSKHRSSRFRSQPLIRSRSRSHSPYGSPSKSNPRSEGGSPGRDLHGEDHRQAMQSVVNIKDSHSKKRRCRDFDEKGFCMRGEMCPYDHGNDPVVLEDVGQVLSLGPPGVPGIPPPMPHPPPILRGPPPMHLRPPFVRPPPDLPEYNPDAPSMEPRLWSKQNFRMSGRGMLRGGGGMIRPAMAFMPHHQRELISVPVMEGEERPFYGPNYEAHSIKRQCPPDFSNEETMPPMKQRFDYNRLGNRRMAAVNCSLQLKKVPAGLNTIAHLHNHFVKFGKINNIQINYEGDPEGAMITFNTHAEASAAYKSTEAVLNNRFIKVFWHNPDKDSKSENPPPPMNLRTSAKERLGAPVVNKFVNVTPTTSKQDPNAEREKVLMSGLNITKTVYMPAAAMEKQMAAAALMKTEPPKKMLITTNFPPPPELLIVRELKRKQEEKRKEAVKLNQHLCKKKHELIDKLLQHQKLLIEKLEKGNISPEQRKEILDAIQGFEDNIQMIRKDLKSVTAKPVNNTVKVTPQVIKRTKEETQKQILDAELDLFNHQQEGKDTSELQKRVLELKTKAQSLGLIGSHSINNHSLPNQHLLRLARNATRFRTIRGRGGFNPHATVDHRPTKLLVSGFESDDKAEVLEHFSKFGEVVDHVWDEATPAIVIQFKTRKDAETAMAKGRNFQDRLMSVTWFGPSQSHAMRGAGMRSVILLNDNVGDLLSEHDEEEEALRINLDSSEDFLLQDEEEEEDEERSWRR